MNNQLRLNMYLMKKNRACLVFKKDGILFRVNHLTQALQFVAEMEQLAKAIDTGAAQEWYYELVDDRAKKLVFECGFDLGVLSLCVWKPDDTSAKFLSKVFCWEGSSVEFRKAVRDLALMASCARIFNVYRKG
ncbi:hypothetical protein [Pedobacter sp.]|jgi:hypothetical protein|uniref:hypothetical protein n=1 Tax=Pedobacter sp. TaxID=1411316 RepID=UPI002B5CAB9A|nr:hypothetical protein [Pedobacter sp.]HWW40875.1 hypothetical protein [Pedobacter sp.]